MKDVKVKVAQSCATLCNPMYDTVHGILQARILEWIAFPLSRGSSQPKDRTQVSHIAVGVFTSWATGKAKNTGGGSFPFSSGSSRHRNWTGASCIAGGFFTNWAIREAHIFNGLTHRLSKECFMCACEECIIYCSWMSVSGYLLGLITLLLLVLQVLTNLLNSIHIFSIHYRMLVKMYPPIIPLLPVYPFNFVGFCFM